jgi:hypothetical protein
MPPRERQPWEPVPVPPLTPEQRREALEQAMLQKPAAGPKKPVDPVRQRQRAIEEAMLRWISTQITPPARDLRPPFIVTMEKDKTKALYGRGGRVDLAIVDAAREAARIRALFKENRVPRTYDPIRYAALRCGLPLDRVSAVAIYLARSKAKKLL